MSSPSKSLLTAFRQRNTLAGRIQLVKGQNKRNCQSSARSVSSASDFKREDFKYCHAKCSNTAVLLREQLLFNIQLLHGIHTSTNQCCVSSAVSKNDENDYLECSDPETKSVMLTDMTVIANFITEEEEKNIFEEVEPHLKRLRYESNHWDDAIHGYRETERSRWSENNKKIIQRVRETAFAPGVKQLALVHVLDLKKDGYIKPHVDAERFCGTTIAGISLLSPSVMRLVHTEDKSKFADILLERRSLYIMKDAARYKYTHEILPGEQTVFRGKQFQKDRRISVICRNEPGNQVQ